MNRRELKGALLSMEFVQDFEELALAVFHYQSTYNAVYKAWLGNLNIEPAAIKNIDAIPFLPISAFKTKKIISGDIHVSTVFSSSGTTGSSVSKHHVADVDGYLQNARRIFEDAYGKVEDYCFLALLPSYLERSGSSLICMVEDFIKASRYDISGFYLNEHEALHSQLRQNQQSDIPTILFGVSFGLLDFAEQYQLSYPELIIIETGGMKGRREEITREELHTKLQSAFGCTEIHSEYGMTELLSQSYSKGKGIFLPGRTMKVVIHEPTDPFTNAEMGKSGIVSIIDVANIDSCAFIQTEDLGRCYNDGSFEILGRIDKSDVRGCNLMVSDI